jgi:multiple sugar transport system substrate-binding protein
MKSRNPRKIFVSVFSAVAVLTGAFSGMIPTKASLSFGAENQEVHVLKGADSEADLESADETTTIRIGTWYTEDNLTNLKAYLAGEFPNYNFVFEYIGKSNYEPIMDSKLSYKGAPDIIYVTGEMAEKHARTGYIANLSDITEKFNMEAKMAFGYGNAVYAVPNTSDLECIFYNKDMFSAKGAGVPTDFNTFIGACDYFRVVRKIRPLAASLKDPYGFANSALGVLSANYFSTDRGSGFGARLQYGRATFSDELRPYMKDWETLIEHKVLTADMYTIDGKRAIEEFVSEEAAMIVGTPETYVAIREARPDMNIGTLPYFGTEGEGMAIIGGCDLGFALNANAMNYDKAKEVLASLARVKGQEALWKDRPGSQTYLEDTAFNVDEAFKGIEDCYKKELVFTPWMDWGQDLNRRVHYTYGRELQKVLLKRESLEMALSNVDKLVYEILHE